MTIVFHESGNARCLHTEVIPLSTLGTLSVSRASTVEFDEASQQWEVRTDEQGIIFADQSRDQCLAWERRHFEERL